MNRQYIDKIKLPDKPGVYIFLNSRKRPIYIGRATSLKDRVKSYFALDLIETRGPRIIDMVTKATALKWQETDSVLEAIILESSLIKKYQPLYNVDEKDDKSSLYIVITDELWPRVFTVRARDYEHEQQKTSVSFKTLASYKTLELFGPYPHGGLITEALKVLRKIFPFKDKKSRDSRHEAFYQALGRSPSGQDNLARRRYKRTIQNLILFMEGKKQTLQTRLEKEMKSHARRLQFEEASRIKRTLFALKHINDMALIKQESAREENADNQKGLHQNFRMEAYDIAHLSGTNVVGAMTVSVNGELARQEYRKFKISRDSNNDTANLAELISRRLNHSEWTYPDLIIVDGNEVQLKVAVAVLSARRINISVVGVTKNDKHKAEKVIGPKEIVDKYSKQIIALNAEAHRFAIAYHRKRRTAGMHSGLKKY